MNFQQRNCVHQSQIRHSIPLESAYSASISTSNREFFMLECLLGRLILVAHARRFLVWRRIGVRPVSATGSFRVPVFGPFQRLKFSAFFMLYIFSFAQLLVSLIFQDLLTIFFDHFLFSFWPFYILTNALSLDFNRDHNVCNFLSSFKRMSSEISQKNQWLWQEWYQNDNLWENSEKFCWKYSQISCRISEENARKNRVFWIAVVAISTEVS